MSWHVMHDESCKWKPAGTWFDERLKNEMALRTDYPRIEAVAREAVDKWRGGGEPGDSMVLLAWALAEIPRAETAVVQNDDHPRFPFGARVRVQDDPTLATVVRPRPRRYVYVRFDGEREGVNHPMTEDELTLVAPVTGSVAEGK